MAGPDTRFGTYKVSEWREGVQPQKNMDTENNQEPAFFFILISH